jgi:hypothetical protein
MKSRILKRINAFTSCWVAQTLANENHIWGATLLAAFSQEAGAWNNRSVLSTTLST